jgi:hypothetical protein
MAHHLDVLRGKAFVTIPGEAYNRYREEAEAGSASRSCFYEVVLTEHSPWAYLSGRVYPGFARYLEYKKLDPQTAQGVIVTLFLGSRCHLIEGPDFLRAFMEIERLDAASFRLRLSQWLREITDQDSQRSDNVVLLPRDNGQGNRRQ